MIARCLRQLSFLLAVALIPALISAAYFCNAWPDPEVLSEGEVSIKALPQTPILWVDARTSEAFAKEHIPEAINLNSQDWDSQIPAFLDAWNPGISVIVYCDGAACDASHAVAQRLKDDLQLSDPVLVLKGGWEAWKKKN